MNHRLSNKMLIFPAIFYCKTNTYTRHVLDQGKREALHTSLRTLEEVAVCDENAVTVGNSVGFGMRRGTYSQ